MKYLICLVIFFVGCQNDVAVRKAALLDDEPIDVQATEHELKHPLEGVEPIDGLVPGIDIHRSPQGHKYAFGETTTGLHDGTIEHHSGLIELESVYEEYDKPLRQSSNSMPKPKVHPSVEHMLLLRESDPRIAVRIGFYGGEDEEHLYISRLRRRALGQSEADLLERKQQRITLSAEGVLQWLVEHEVEYVVRQNSYFIMARLDPDQIQQLAQLPQVKSISALGPYQADWVAGDLDLTGFRNAIDGAEIHQGTQTSQYVLAGFDGRQQYGTRTQAAVFERGLPNFRHPGFKDHANSNGRRFLGKYDCGVFSCSASNSTSLVDAHANNVAQIIAGDLHNAQDQNMSVDWLRWIYRGMSPESTMYAYAMNNSGFDSAVDHVLGLGNAPDVVNMSYTTWMYGYWFHDCYGDWDEDELINDLFERGILVFKSAGNVEEPDYGDVSDQCWVGVPGSAMGAFTVGNYLRQRTGGINATRDGALHPSTPFGGMSFDRTIIDMVGPGFRNWRFDDDVSSPGYMFAPSTGTSYSTPTVAGAALNLLDFYRRKYGSYLDNAGALFASMLLMGDRVTDSQPNGAGGFNLTRANTHFHSRWGAGHLKMRLFEHGGMDYPWRYVRYSVCVDDGETVKFHFGPNAPQGAYAMSSIPDDVEHLKAVIYWYDRRLEDHGDVSRIDDIDLRVRGYESYVYTTHRVLASSASSYDNKERVYVNFDQRPLVDRSLGVTVEITGYDVTADHEGCGTNSMRVWLAMYYEDGDRDDADGPTTMIESP